MSMNVVTLLYLIASVCFIQALKGLEPVRRMPGMYTHTVHPLHIVQEALSNVRKHADASRVWVDVRQHPCWQFEVRDNGVGFARSALPDEETHVGLRIMAERAERIGARNEIAQHRGLRQTAGIGVMSIVPRARPAELGDHDALAGIHLAQAIVAADGVVDRDVLRTAFPVGKDVDGDVIDRGDKLRMVAPDAPDFTGRHRHLRLALDALDHLDQAGDVDVFLGAVDADLISRRFRVLQVLQLFGRKIELLVADQRGLAAVDGFVADHDAVDIGVSTGKFDDRANFALVALGIIVEPGAGRDFQSELVCDRRHQFDALRR